MVIYLFFPRFVLRMFLTAVALNVSVLIAQVTDPVPIEDIPGGGKLCLFNATASASVDRNTVALGDGVNVRYSKSHCPLARMFILPDYGEIFGPSAGTVTVYPASTGPQQFYLFQNGSWRWVADLPISVTPPPRVNGRAYIRIHSTTSPQTFINACGTPYTTIRLDDNILLDLSGWVDNPIHIARGVEILGGRSTTNWGPTIRCARGAQLFTINQSDDADGVHISGICIDGGDADRDEPDDNVFRKAITIYNCRNVEVGNCEIYGWSGAGVSVQGISSAGITLPGQAAITNPSSVRIHDCFIHHNRHLHGNGYGVEVEHGSYALIEKNVFDWNRHSIMGGNWTYTGYIALDNLVIGNGGYNGLGQDTHTLDVHGTNNGFPIPVDHYSGPAGEYFNFAYNAVFFNKTQQIKVRGYPAFGVDIVHNRLGWYVNGDLSRFNNGYEQTDGNNLRPRENVEYAGPMEVVLAVGDFNADGVADDFLSTGVTWWYRSGVTHQWYYLCRSDLFAHNGLKFQVNPTDGITTDVVTPIDSKEKGATHWGGTANWSRIPTSASRSVKVKPNYPNFYVQNSDNTVDCYHFEDGHWENLVSVPVPLDPVQNAPMKLLGQTDFDGDGVPDLLFKAPGSGYTLKKVLMDKHAIPLPTSPLDHFDTVPVGYTYRGVADFNNDNRSDILWKTAEGEYVIWYNGDRGNEQRMAPTPGEPSKVPSSYQVIAVGDFDGDGYADIAFQSGNSVILWFLKNGELRSTSTTTVPDNSGKWFVSNVGDINNDGKDDIIWRNNASGHLIVAFGGIYERSHADLTYGNLPNFDAGLDWIVDGLADVDEKGYLDLHWTTSNKGHALWKMNGPTFVY
jgi:FG-GAP-like repeat